MMSVGQAVPRVWPASREGGNVHSAEDVAAKAAEVIDGSQRVRGCRAVQRRFRRREHVSEKVAALSRALDELERGGGSPEPAEGHASLISPVEREFLTSRVRRTGRPPT